MLVGYTRMALMCCFSGGLFLSARGDDICFYLFAVAAVIIRGMMSAQAELPLSR